MWWFLATCTECRVIMPFITWEERDTWAREHTQTVDPLTNQRHKTILLDEQDQP